MNVIVGLDTSCYTTSCAAVSLDGEVLASCRKLLPVRQGQRGLRQSEAVFAHVRQLPELMEQLGNIIKGHQIVAVCASGRPRDAEDSYMPVFTVGEAHGRAIAAMLGIPCFFSTHQRGHIAAAKIDSGIRDKDFLAVHLSGGTTEILALRGSSLDLLGGTLDLHAGQLVDRCGVAMGMSFPSGPSLEALAVSGQAFSQIPVSMENRDLGCHFSGAEARVKKWLQDGRMTQPDIAMEIYDFLARTIARLVIAGKRETGLSSVLIAGGVASSGLFRKLVTERILKKEEMMVCFGKPEYSGDNAVGAAMIGRELYLRGEKNNGSCSS